MRRQYVTWHICIRVLHKCKAQWKSKLYNFNDLYFSLIYINVYLFVGVHVKVIWYGSVNVSVVVVAFALKRAQSDTATLRLRFFFIKFKVKNRYFSYYLFVCLFLIHFTYFIRANSIQTQTKHWRISHYLFSECGALGKIKIIRTHA